jgi:hypothetical protein
MFRSVAIVLSAVVGLLVLAGGLFFFFNTNVAQTATEVANVRSTPYYSAAVQTISVSPELNDRLGAPMVFGDVQVKDLNVDRASDTGSVVLDIQVTGPKESGHVQMKVMRPNEKLPWANKGGDYFPAKEGPPVHLAPR